MVFRGEEAGARQVHSKHRVAPGRNLQTDPVHLPQHRSDIAPGAALTQIHLDIQVNPLNFSPESHCLLRSQGAESAQEELLVVEAERSRAFALAASEQSHVLGVPAPLCLGDGSAGPLAPSEPGAAVDMHPIQAYVGKKPVGSDRSHKVAGAWACLLPHTHSRLLKCKGSPRLH